MKVEFVVIREQETGRDLAVRIVILVRVHRNRRSQSPAFTVDVESAVHRRFDVDEIAKGFLAIDVRDYRNRLRRFVVADNVLIDRTGDLAVVGIRRVEFVFQKVIPPVMVGRPGNLDRGTTDDLEVPSERFERVGIGVRNFPNRMLARTDGSRERDRFDIDSSGTTVISRLVVISEVRIRDGGRSIAGNVPDPAGLVRELVATSVGRDQRLQLHRATIVHVSVRYSHLELTVGNQFPV
ncbi:hypothetical protein [Haloterrigena salinisoli]|uniref:hypothetical protein n=1 Tax=Haloterrigena salinisoli TaxID=3132747 RepID=UPI0030D2072E